LAFPLFNWSVEVIHVQMEDDAPLLPRLPNKKGTD
jgi:hypothetical protein